MSIQFVDQISSLSIFTGVDMETGEPLPTETWSDKAWVTEFAEALALNGLVLSWTDCVVYHHRVAYVIPAGSHVFTADPAYSTSVVVWLDPASPDDNLTIDVVLLDGTQEPEAAPIAADDIVRLAWGTIGAGATEMTLNVLKHRGEF